MNTDVYCYLRPCCFDCKNADIIVKSTRIGKTLRRQNITCSHENVCVILRNNSARPTIEDLIELYIEGDSNAPMA